LKRNGEELKKLKIGDKIYNYERGKPISKRLITKFNKIRQTMDYKRYELKEKRGIGWVNLDKNKALTGIQKLFKATITDEQSAFKNLYQFIRNQQHQSQRHQSTTISQIPRRQNQRVHISRNTRE